jgi:hypothetical protein
MKPLPCGHWTRKWHRIEALLRNRAFIEDYVRARDTLRKQPRSGSPSSYDGVLISIGR